MPEGQSRVAIVTGASRGIGRATALALAGAGCRVVVNYRESREAAEEVRARAQALAPGPCLAVRADVSREDEVAVMVGETLERLGRIDILVNNAGISDPRRFLDIDLARWNRMVEVNLTGAFLCCHAVLGHMRERKRGRIINVSSTSGLSGGTSGAHYAASKGGLIALTRALASEFARDGITVNAIVPSKIDTEMLRSALGESGAAAQLGKIPVGRFGTPEEIAGLAVYLASEQAGYITGEAITASGGYR
jgi:3-oxoacyl-[acyl-carrier protein] reductase